MYNHYDRNYQFYSIRLIKYFKIKLVIIKLVKIKRYNV